jgi:NAD(P)-dependent dehydrogenase (short-subunit alcohol dehydrogenase family)
MGSVMAELGGANLTAYAASKGALAAVTRALAHELKGTSITVNCVMPGAIQVEKEQASVASNGRLIDWQTLPRRLTPHDLFGLLALLLSEAGAAITGQAITVDGGLLHPIADPRCQAKLTPAVSIPHT